MTTGMFHSHGTIWWSLSLNVGLVPMKIYGVGNWLANLMEIPLKHFTDKSSCFRFVRKALTQTFSMFLRRFSCWACFIMIFVGTFPIGRFCSRITKPYPNFWPLAFIFSWIRKFPQENTMQNYLEICPLKP